MLSMSVFFSLIVCKVYSFYHAWADTEEILMKKTPSMNQVIALRKIN